MCALHACIYFVYTCIYLVYICIYLIHIHASISRIRVSISYIHVFISYIRVFISYIRVFIYINVSIYIHLIYIHVIYLSLCTCNRILHIIYGMHLRVYGIVWLLYMAHPHMTQHTSPLKAFIVGVCEGFPSIECKKYFSFSSVFVLFSFFY